MKNKHQQVVARAAVELAKQVSAETTSTYLFQLHKQTQLKNINWRVRTINVFSDKEVANISQLSSGRANYSTNST